MSNEYEMQDFACPADIPTAETLGGGIYTVRIAACEPQVNEKTGKLVVKCEYRILSHDLSNAPLFDMIWIGTDADPLARDPNTWKEARGGGRKFARLMQAAGVAAGTSLKTNCQTLLERQLMIRLTEREGKGDNAGNIYNNVVAFFPLGEREESRDAPKGIAPAAGGGGSSNYSNGAAADMPAPRPVPTGGTFE